MINSEPDPVHEWNIDTSWQDWPHGGLWNTALDGEELSPDADPTVMSSENTAHRSPLTSAGPSMFDPERSMSESQPQ